MEFDLSGLPAFRTSKIQGSSLYPELGKFAFLGAGSWLDADLPLLGPR